MTTENATGTALAVTETGQVPAIATPLPEPLQKMLAMASSEYWSSSDLERLARDRDLLPAAIDAAAALLEPAGPKVINKAVEFLAALPSQAMNDNDARMALQLYRIGLKDMPRDLLSLAAERAARTCHWRPTPAQLRELVQDELKGREKALSRLRAAARLAPPEHRIAPVYGGFDTKAILDAHWPDRDRHRTGNTQTTGESDHG
jgi:hypothetical protein